MAANTRVVFITNSEGFGGTERHLIELIRRLDRSRTLPAIVELGEPVYEQALQADDIACEVYRPERPPASLWQWVRLFKYLQPDVAVFVNNWYRSFTYDAFVAARLASVRRRSSVHHLEAPEPQSVQGWTPDKILRRIAGGRVRRLLAFRVSTACLDTVVCVSNAVRRRLVLSYGFPRKKTMTVHNGVSVEQFAKPEASRAASRGKMEIEAGTFLLVCVARLIEQKGIRILIQALAQVSRAGVRCKCIIAGDGPQRAELVELADSLSVTGIVEFHGFTRDVRPLLQAADAFVLASFSEGLPLSILEAMASGLPCIVTDSGGSAEAVTHMSDGLVVTPGSVEQLAGAITYMAGNPQMRAVMAERARERVCRDFQIDKCMARVEEALIG